MSAANHDPLGRRRTGSSAAARLQKDIEDPLSEALIQGTLPRPSELEVYLGDTGIYYRLIATDAETPVTAGGPAAEAPAETLLYTF